MNDIEQFTLAELSIRVFASPETFAALYDDVLALLETKYERSAWEVASQEDVTDNAEALDRLRREADVARRSS
ncbi:MULTISPECIES: hypothetical protein [Microbacterium]|uniref:hypothetical protein n=1 Tax=Microbacterium TaxID=33882 RepID=UPI00214BEFBD|nr:MULTISPECIES: hypothetical protein [unclassified Microbacterium]MCR2812539.1 hypothetical protein [Microbacterium sp. zg.Y1084]MDL5485697.1 hypothetical protein [Microbacterium sp. zg-Y1211]